MKNIFESKGFYVVLYSCVVGLAVIASVITYSNLNALRHNKHDEVASVANNQSESYKTKSKENSNSLFDNEKSKSQTSPGLNNDKPKTQSPLSEVNEEKQKLQSSPKSNPSNAITTASPEITPSTPTTTPGFEEDTSQNNETSFKSFDDNDKMAWPVFGEIVMSYSNEHAIYDKTLDQYRTNDCISVAAQTGEQVKASADGIVKLVTKTDDSGNTIVIEHGNGWTTTYSQLQDNILVNEGDIVKSGQVIGGVANPTKNSILLGSHLDFKIAKDEQVIDPRTILTN